MSGKPDFFSLLQDMERYVVVYKRTAFSLLSLSFSVCIWSLFSVVSLGVSAVCVQMGA